MSAASTPRGRLVVLTTSYPAYVGDPSGHFVAAEVQALRASGLDVVVLAPRPATGAREGDGVVWLDAGSAFGWPGAPARLAERPLRLVSALGFVLRARRALRRAGAVDRVIAHFALPCAWPIAGARPPGAPLEVVVHGSDVRWLERLPRPLRARVRQALASASVRAVSRELVERLERALGPELARRVQVTPGACDVSGAPTHADARRELGVDAAMRLVVVAGRLVAAKRLPVALRAARLIPGAQAVIVGDGPERGALERAFPEARFVGLAPRRRALAWLAAADVVLSASLDEGSPSVVREARALGTPVAALAAGDLVERAADDPSLVVVRQGA